ncbi:MAG: TraM recognition domain-containing protein, partial [Patescibacteria group bacterium]|nr:TraM recognition domain-containing protein [Patescibacteria group bacterium]
AELPEDQRHDFYLYIDEFQNFVTDSIATILSEARKYRLDLIISHQYVGQLVDAKGNTQIRDAVFGNVGTSISFKICVEDAEMVAKVFAPVFNEYDMINIDKYQAYIKLLIDNAAAKPFQMATYAPEAGNAERAQKIKERSAAVYGVPRPEVEASITGKLSLGKEPSPDEEMEAEIKASLT